MYRKIIFIILLLFINGLLYANMDKNNIKLSYQDGIVNNYVRDNSKAYTAYAGITDITLQTFNDGIFYAETVDTIKWIADTSVHNVEISYTTDNGNTWTSIDIVPNTGSYVWTIPKTISDSCRIKLQSLDQTDVYDISDNVFRIVGFILNSANNGDTLERGNNYTIEWESYMNDVYMAISYSTNGGSGWNSVEDSTDNDGEYIWCVDTDTLGSCLLRLILKNNTTIYDDTTISVYIVDRLEITSPNGGEELDPNTTYRIEWTCDTTVEYVSLYYTTDRGATWNLIKGGAFASLGYYNWTVPDVNTGNALIKITDYNDSTIYDISDDVFIIGDNSFADGLVNISHITIPTLSTNGIAIKYELSESTPINVKIYDMIGRLIKKETLYLKRGRSIYNIPVNRQGIYFIKIYNTNGELLKQGKVSVVR